MLTVRDPKKMPRSWSADLREAIGVAFAVERSTTTQNDFVKTALLMRLIRSKATPTLQVVLTEIIGPGDVAEQVGRMDPSGFTHVQVGHRQVGAIVTCDMWSAPDHAGDAEDGGDVGEWARAIVGVMASRWSFQMYQRPDGKRPVCQVAPPTELGEVGRALAEPLAALNDKFRYFLS